MNRITKHVYANLIDGIRINDTQINLDNKFTIQNSLDIPMGLSTEPHKLNVLTIGTRPNDASGNPIVSYDTNPLNTTLFNHIPFFAIKESDEIGTRPQYRLRKLVIKNSIRYIVYYGLSFTPTIVSNRLLLLKDDNGYIVDEFNPLAYDVRTPRYSIGYTYDKNLFIVNELTLSAILTPDVLRGIYEANLLLNGTELNINEIGLCGSSDGVNYVTQNSAQITIPEAKDCILAYSIKHDITLTAADILNVIEQKTIKFELGGMELTQLDVPIRIL